MAILAEIQDQETTAQEYDVFLSFRGKDTRLAFTDHLYHALISANISTFLDDEEVETGEELNPELEKAIKSSRSSIIVLSENYASSTWCLDELLIILDRRRTSNHIVLPIFYHVEPTHVRKQKGSFVDALNTHKKRMEAEEDQEKKSQLDRKLKLWTKALTEVADLKGKGAKGRSETLFIEEIVKEIYGRLGLQLRSKLPHLIGMDSSISTISSWLTDESYSTANILTIWGMAGIGKTSLAEYIFQSNFHEFERSSFLEGIERKCAEQSSALLDLQKQLLGDLLRRSTIEVRDVNVGTAKLEKVLLNKQALVVLDGIDKLEQLDVLIGTKGFHPGTKVIVTTKDISLIEKCALFHASFPPKHTTHKLSGLNFAQSLRLLCWHAFRGDGPQLGYEEEAERVAKYCGGHPLALKVLGSALINEDIDTWHDVKNMLETKDFYTDIQKVLRISFDSLPSDNCKELFKHIACFFVGEDREVTEATLKECGIRTTYGISKLVQRCLLTITSDNKLRMHQLVLNMGRDLVCQESRTKPWKRSRLWNHEECLSLLKENKGTTKIQGLFLDMELLEEQFGNSGDVTRHKFQDELQNIYRGSPLFHKVCEFFAYIWWIFSWSFIMLSPSERKSVELRTNALERMDNLKILQLNHVKLKGSYKKFPKGLRWLCMHGFQMKYIPSELPMENLVSLDMSHSHLKQLWEKPRWLGSLKFLNLSYCKFHKVGGFSGLPSLERLTLAGCGSLIHVCESIGGCDRLVLLDLSYCKKLKQIPRSIHKLKKLQVLLISGSFGVSDFTKYVPESPKSCLLSLPASLVTLSLANNNLRDESFPTDFSSVSMLKELYLDGNPIHSLPACVRSLCKLERLDVSGCSMLKSILYPPSALKYLFMHDCLSLRRITFHPELSSLPFVYLDGAMPNITLGEACVLRYMVVYCNQEAAKMVIDLNQADANLLNSRGYTMLHVAAMRKESSIILSLLSKGDSASDTTVDGQSAVNICRRLTMLKDNHVRIECGQNIKKDRICIDFLKREINKNPTTGVMPVLEGTDDLKLKLLYLENRAAFAQLLFPSITKLAMEITHAQTNSEFPGLLASKGSDGNLRDLDSNETINVMLSRMEALLTTLEAGRRYFPHCWDVLDEFMDDDLQDLLDNEIVPEAQIIKRTQYVELKEDVERAFTKDTTKSKSQIYSQYHLHKYCYLLKRI